MIKVVGPEHNIKLLTKGSFNDFVLGKAPDESKVLNFLDDDFLYVFIGSRSGFFHFLNNLMIPALQVIEEFDNKTLHFVLDHSFPKQDKDNYDYLLIDLLEDKRINYTKINSDDYEYINAKNFIPVNSGTLEEGIPLLYNYFINKYNIALEKPTKKIYVSRSKINRQEKRIDDENIVEDLFAGYGFEVVYPEDIPTFKEQFELFNSCSVLAGLTGAGLTNLLFMQKNQTAIEIISQLDISFFDKVTGEGGVRQEIHEHYNNFCKIKNLTRIGILNMDKESSSVVDSVNNLMASFATISDKPKTES
jgi:hypothetical protein